MSVCAVGKRQFDSLDSFANPFQFGTLPDQHANGAMIPGTPPKRCRAGSPPSSPSFAFGSSSASSSPPPSFHMGASSPPRKLPIQRIPGSPSRYLPATMAPVDIQSIIDKFAGPARKRTRLNTNGPENGGAMTSLPVLAPQQEVTFTMEQVKAIVQRAVEEKEARMREEFDIIIRENLAEQFEIFTKVNEDYISRQMRESTYDYMS